MNDIIPWIEIEYGEIVGENYKKVVENLRNSKTKALHVIDKNAKTAHAPQNIQITHSLLSELELEIQFSGGIETMHTAELILGLGVSRVVLDAALHKSERSPKYFFDRLQERAIASVETQKQAEDSIQNGAKWLLFAPNATLQTIQSKGINIQVFTDWRNLKQAQSVATAGVLIKYSEMASVNNWKR